MLNVGQQVGGTIGLASLITVFGHAFANDFKAHARTLSPGAAQLHAFTHGADMAFIVGALFCAVGFVLAVSLIRIRPEDVRGSAPGLPG